MKHLSSVLGFVVLSGVVSLAVLAQTGGSRAENTNHQQQQIDNKQQNDATARTRKSVTGCFQEDDKSGGYYSIRTDNGATWLLKSRKVDLSQHVGHEVTANGFLSQRDQTTQSPSTPNTMRKTRLAPAARHRQRAARHES